MKTLILFHICLLSLSLLASGSQSSSRSSSRSAPRRSSGSSIRSHSSSSKKTKSRSSAAKTNKIGRNTISQGKFDSGADSGIILGPNEDLEDYYRKLAKKKGKANRQGASIEDTFDGNANIQSDPKFDFPAR